MGEKDILGYVNLGHKPVYFLTPVPDNKKLFTALKRAAKFFVSLLEKIERGEDV